MTLLFGHTRKSAAIVGAGRYSRSILPRALSVVRGKAGLRILATKIGVQDRASARVSLRGGAGSGQNKRAKCDQSLHSEILLPAHKHTTVEVSTNSKPGANRIPVSAERRGGAADEPLHTYSSAREKRSSPIGGRCALEAPIY